MTEVLFPPLSKETPDAEGVLATWFVTEGSTVTAENRKNEKNKKKEKKRTKKKKITEKKIRIKI